MDAKVELQKISMRGHVIFKLRQPGDSDLMPAVSLQMPIEVAEYLEKLVLVDQYRRSLENN